MKRVLDGWFAKLSEALEAGYNGMRVTGNTAWLEKADWADFEEYEASINMIGSHNLVTLCTYSLEKCNALEIMEVTSNHELALIKQDDRWFSIQNIISSRDRKNLSETEQKYEHSKQMLNSMFDNISDGYFALDSNMIITYFNRAAENLLGRPAKDLVGKRLFEAFPEMKNSVFEAQLTSSIKEKNYVSFETYLDTQLSRNWYDVRILPFDEGIGVYFQVTTEHKNTEMRLKEQAAILDNVNDAVIEYDLNYRVRYWNRNAEVLYGYTAGEALGKLSYDLLKPEYLNRTREELVQIVKTDGHSEVESYRTRKDGKRLYIESHIILLKDQHNRPAGFVSVDRDITGRHLSEKALITTNEQLSLISWSAALLLESDSPEKIITSVCNRVMNLLKCDVFFNYLVDEKSRRLLLNAYAGISSDTAKSIQWLDYGVAVCGCVAKERRRIIAEDILNRKDEMTDLIRSFGVQAYCCHPMIVRGRLLGTLSFGTRTRRVFDASEVDLMHTVVNLVAVAIDRKQNEATLRNSEKEFSAIFSSVPLIIFVVDEEIRVIKANRSALTFAGRKETTITGLRTGEAIRCLNYMENDQGCGFGQACQNCQVRMTIENTFKTGKNYSNVEWHLPFLVDGKREDITFLLSTVLMPSYERQVLVCIEDISERKKAEDSLRETKDYLENLINYANAPIIVWDPELRITRFNHAFERLTGLQAADVVGKDISVLFPPEQKEHSLSHIHETTIAGERWEVIDIPILHTDGSVKTVLWNSANIYGSDNKTVIATIAQGQDITERKQAEEATAKLNALLARHAAELEAINKELEAFSYSVSHDLRAPLRSLEGFSEALLTDYNDKLDEQGKQYLGWIQESSTLMAQLIDDILKLSRITRTEAHFEEVDISEIASEIAGKLKKSTKSRKVDFVIAAGIAANGDYNLIKILLDNLISNAWKFTGRTADAKIEIGVTQVDTQNVYYVRDNGAGFNMKYVDKLFRPFQRLHKAEDFPGSGIGLATVERIVHRHGGKVWAEGKENEGATFFFTLGG